MAERSKDTANNIQNINTLLTAAVKDLVHAADALLEYVNDQIVPDYDEFEDSGKDYDSDAKHVHQVINSLNDAVKGMNMHLTNMNDSLDGIVSAAEDGERVVEDASTKAEILAGSISTMSQEMDA